MFTGRVRTVSFVAVFIFALAIFSTVPADASPITFTFKTINPLFPVPPGESLDPWGVGSFTFDDSLLGSPFTEITHDGAAGPSPDELTAFSYSDPVVDPTGTAPFTLASVASFHFVFGSVNGFSVNASNIPTNTIAISGGPATPSDNAFAISSNSSTGGFNFSSLVFPVQSTAPTPIPEPASLLLFGTGLVAVARRVRRSRQP